jgi:hypothetical protein
VESKVEGERGMSQMEHSVGYMKELLAKAEAEVERLRAENAELRYAKEVRTLGNATLRTENLTLKARLAWFEKFAALIEPTLTAHQKSLNALHVLTLWQQENPEPEGES